jgi:hypothetical protein
MADGRILFVVDFFIARIRFVDRKRIIFLWRASLLQLTAIKVFTLFCGGHFSRHVRRIRRSCWASFGWFQQRWSRMRNDRKVTLTTARSDAFFSLLRRPLRGHTVFLWVYCFSVRKAGVGGVLNLGRGSRWPSSNSGSIWRLMAFWRPGPSLALRACRCAVLCPPALPR